MGTHVRIKDFKILKIKNKKKIKIKKIKKKKEIPQTGLLLNSKLIFHHSRGYEFGTVGKESTCQCRRCKILGFDPWVRKTPWSREWQPTPIFLLGKFHGQRSLVAYIPWECIELDLTEHALAG